MVAEHIHRGMQAVVSRGRPHTSADVYRTVGAAENLNREFHPEAAIVHRIFRETAEGRFAVAIAIRLNGDRLAASK